MTVLCSEVPVDVVGGDGLLEVVAVLVLDGRHGPLAGAGVLGDHGHGPLGAGEVVVEGEPAFGLELLADERRDLVLLGEEDRLDLRVDAVLDGLLVGDALLRAPGADFGLAGLARRLAEGRLHLVREDVELGRGAVGQVVLLLGAGRLAGAGRAQRPILDVVALGLDADAVERAEEIHQPDVLVLHRTHGLEEAVDHGVDHVQDVALLLGFRLARAVLVHVREELEAVLEDLLGLRSGRDGRELVADGRELGDLAQAVEVFGEVRRHAAIRDVVLEAFRVAIAERDVRVAHRVRLHHVLRAVDGGGVVLGAVRVEDVEALVHGLLDRGDVGVVLEAGVRGGGLRLLLDPVVVLGLEGLREAVHRTAAEEVREPVAAREARLHAPVFERDVERVVVDLDLPADGSVSVQAEEVVLERNVGDVGYGLDGHLVFPWVGGPVAVAVSPILHESGAECYKNRAWRGGGGDPATRPDAAGGG